MLLGLTDNRTTTGLARLANFPRFDAGALSISSCRAVLCRVSNGYVIENFLYPRSCRCGPACAKSCSHMPFGF